MIGSVCGAFVAVPIPVLGPIIGALGGGMLGAFGGAWAGEAWKGSDRDKGLSIGWAAAVGRLLGTAGKMSIGAIMFVVAAIDVFV